jgi:hypothetical protein
MGGKGLCGDAGHHGSHHKLQNVYD